ncbi:MAG: T9SS type A sorting domain-containing protein [Bacteroidia bacterium]
MNKRIYLTILLLIYICKFSTAQIICIYCYDQNDTISGNVTNLISNGGFENNGCTPDSENISFCPNSFYHACNIPNWTCTGGGTYTYACSIDSLWSVIPEGSRAIYFGNNECKSCSQTMYDTSCISNLSCTTTGIPPGYPVSNSYFGGTSGVSMQQTVSGLTPGNIYVLEFWAGGEYHFIGINNFPDKGIFAVDVGFGDTLMREKPTPPITGIGTRYIIEFIANSTSHTIKFTNWGHMCQTCTELIIDDVRLYTPAELSSSVPACNTGINVASTFQELISISPNPFTNELNVKAINNQLSEIILSDIASKIFLRKQFTNSVSLNTEQLAKGIYLYEVRDKNGLCKQGKVVKE